jgi:hypothetical protein
MSRGLGKMQRFWVQIAACDDSIAKPWSFAEICRNAIEIEEAAMRPALKRSLRRALADVVKFNLVICLGTRRGVFVRMGYRPARYMLNPSVLPRGDPRIATINAHLAKCGLKVSVHKRTKKRTTQ